MMAPGILFLVGFMGAGKTTAGRELARRLGWRFLDLDERIVAEAGRSVAEIFSKEGEAGFRRRESRALSEVLRETGNGPATVVALGGGAWAQAQNRLRVDEVGAPVVFLDAPLDVLAGRCAADTVRRPLFDDAENFRRLYEVRLEDYRRGTVRVNTQRKSPGQVVEEVMTSLQLNAVSKETEGS